jgi:hypothetical protein
MVFKQTLAPASLSAFLDAYSPAAQGLHSVALPPKEIKPAGHTEQSVSLIAPSFAIVPSGQLKPSDTH